MGTPTSCSPPAALANLPIREAGRQTANGMKPAQHPTALRVQGCFYEAGLDVQGRRVRTADAHQRQAAPPSAAASPRSPSPSSSRGKESGMAVIIVASGANRVCEESRRPVGEKLTARCRFRARVDRLRHRRVSRSAMPSRSSWCWTRIRSSSRKYVRRWDAVFGVFPDAGKLRDYQRAVDRFGLNGACSNGRESGNVRSLERWR